VAGSATLGCHCFTATATVIVTHTYAAPRYFESHQRY
jgi:hypothetical protein